MRLCLALLPLLAACAALPPMLAAPDSIDLLKNRLTVHFSDGSQCSADLGAAPSGSLPGCANGTDYAVEIHHDVWINEAKGFMEPYATVTLTRTADGRRYTWRTPEGGEEHKGINYGTVN